MPDPEFTLDPPHTEQLIDRIVQVWAAVTNAGGAVGFVGPVSATDVEPHARETLRRVVEGDDHLVIASRDGRLVGFTFLQHRPGRLFRHWATVKRFQVDPAVQGTGLGGALLEAVHGFARDLGLEHLRLTVRGGTGTEAFYRRFGWDEVVRMPRSIQVSEGDVREEIWLIRWL